VSLRALLTAALTGVFVAGVGGWLASWAPPPTAEVALGSEGAFAHGLHPREKPRDEPPLRWTEVRARFDFERLPPGPSRLEIRILKHRTPVRVVADGAIVGVLAPGSFEGDYELPARASSRLHVELITEGFVAGGGRRLGTRLGRVRVVPERAGWSPEVALLIGLVATTWALVASRWGVSAVVAAGVLGGCLTGVLLWPAGVLFSPYARVLAGLMIAGATAARVFGEWQQRRRPGSALPAFVALQGAWLACCVLATSPLMVVSDVMFHANTLAEVAGGDLFPTSQTQHAPPFRIPYGLSFYAVLAPLLWLGLDAADLVRWGAGVSGLLAAAALFAALARVSPWHAGVAVILLQALPASFLPYSYGNLSNVFAQSLLVMLFAWWVGGRPGGAVTGAVLAVAGGLAHLSGFVVLLAFAAAALGFENREGRRQLAVSVGVGCVLAGAYFASFGPLILEQLPRMLEGGRGQGASSGLPAAIQTQALSIWRGWGWPALALLAVGWPRNRQTRLEKATLALLVAGGLLALAATISPLEVRYVYALTLPVAVCTAAGALRLASTGRAGFAAALGLAAAQVWLAGRDILEALLHRYRP
jgi:hypothetical protein